MGPSGFPGRWSSVSQGGSSSVPHEVAAPYVPERYTRGAGQRWWGLQVAHACCMVVQSFIRHWVMFWDAVFPGNSMCCQARSFAHALVAKGEGPSFLWVLSSSFKTLMASPIFCSFDANNINGRQAPRTPVYAFSNNLMYPAITATLSCCLEFAPSQ